MKRWTDDQARAALAAIFAAAVREADPASLVAAHLPPRPKGRCLVVGAGKASAAMAAALEAAWPDVDLQGLIVSPSGHDAPGAPMPQRIAVMAASHPVPDERSVEAGRRIMALVETAGPEDLVVALMSGGGSALMVLPAGAMSLADKRAVNRALLTSGAAIGEMNTVRKALSAIKGGRLAAACRAPLVTLVISDVPGDDPAAIASGPTVAGPDPRPAAAAIVRRYGLVLPPAAEAVIAGANELPQPRAGTQDIRLIGTPLRALRAAAEAAKAQGLIPLILGDAIEGEAKEVGIVMAGIARAVRSHGIPVAAPAVLLSGGETTVTLGAAAAGQGGRNTELMLSFALAAGGDDGIWGMACDSDGIDGVSDAAGCMVAPDTLLRAQSLGLDPRRYLDAHDSYRFFAQLNDLVVTGPTYTNVNDIRAILIA